MKHYKSLPARGFSCLLTLPRAVAAFLFFGLVAASGHAGAQPPPDYSGSWNISVAADLPDDGGTCNFEGSTTLTQMGADLSGVVNLTLETGPFACPPQVSASIAASVQGNGCLTTGIWLSVIGDGTFAGCPAGSGDTLAGTFEATEGPFTGATGDWSAAPQPGTIIIVKDAQPDDSRSFDFTGDLGAFSLDDDGVGANSITFTDILPGTYNVSEIVPAGWNLESIACDDPDSESIVDLPGASAAIDLDSGEAVTCTFVNAEIPPQPGSITIIHDAQPDSPQAFEFTGDLGDFTLHDDGDGPNSQTFTGVLPGTYAVTELIPEDWTLTAITCVDPDGETTVDLAAATAFIDLDEAEDLTCTFRNAFQAPIASIPALSEWMALFLAALLGGAAIRTMRRGKRA